MIVRKTDRSIRRSTWPPGTWLPPDINNYRYSSSRIQFSWQKFAKHQALHPPIHYTKGGNG